jgi:hypothetical protein
LAISVSPHTDPFSGQPEAKATPVAVAPLTFAYQGFALAAEPLAMPDGVWWARVALPGAAGIRFATNDPPMAWHDRAPDLFPQAVLTEYVDRTHGLIAPRRSSMAASKARCSSDPQMHHRNGAIFARWSAGRHRGIRFRDLRLLRRRPCRDL